MKLKSIQSLRALAVVLVVYAHSIDLQMAFSTSWQQNFFYLENFGAVGVDIFFIISGFIITYIAYDNIGKKQSLRFIYKRAIRVNLIYYLASILFILRLSIHPGLSFSPAATSHSSLLKTLLILPTMDKSSWISPVLIIGWTLSFEWFFYLIFSSLIFLKIKSKFIFLTSIITSLVVAGLIMKSQDARLIFMTNPIILEFLLGAIICWIYFFIPIGKYLSCFLIVSALAVFIIEIVFGFGEISGMATTLNAKSSGLRVLLWGIPGALLVCGAVFAEKNQCLNRWWNNSLLQAIGNSSYSIYLTHPIVFSIFVSIYIKMGSFLNPDISVIFQVVIAVTAGLLFYLFIESPLLKLLNNGYRKRKEKITV